MGAGNLAAVFLHPALRLYLGRRRLPAGAHRSHRPMHAGADRCDTRGQRRGLPRFPGRHAGERAKLAELLVDLQGARPSLSHPSWPTGDGALGFWKALEEVSPTTRHQRCTVHKTVNVLDKLPESVPPAGQRSLREVWAAPDRATAQATIATFTEKSRTKYAKASSCLIKDRDALLNLLRLARRALGPSANLRIQSRACAQRCGIGTVRTKGALSQDTAG